MTEPLYAVILSVAKNPDDVHITSTARTFWPKMRRIDMTVTAREKIFGAGRLALIGDVALYIFAMIHIRTIAEDTSKLANTLHIAALYFVYGSLLALVALVLVLFGRGWKKLPLSMACVAILPFWYAFTCY